MRPFIIVIIMVAGLGLAYRAAATGDAVVAWVLAGGVGVYLWRLGMMEGPFAVVGLLGGLVLLGVAAVATVRDARGAHWASTLGTTAWAAPSCTAHPASGSRGDYQPPYTTCIARIFYRYHVADRDYVGTRVTFNDLLLWAVDWNWEAGYERKAQVTVRYDPANPALAVLEPRTPGRALLWFVGVLFTLGCGHVLLTNRGDAVRADDGADGAA